MAKKAKSTSACLDLRVIRARAEALRAEFRETGKDTGQTFSHDDYVKALLARCQDLQGDALAFVVRRVAKDIDDGADDDRGRSKGAYLPGIDWDLDGELRLPQKQRIAKRFALLEHVQAALNSKKDNFERVRDALRFDREEFRLLRPYLIQGLNVEQAVEAYKKDHPQAGDAAGG